jgi:predicted Holliday junction resolvase-like endonuclease
MNLDAIDEYSVAIGKLFRWIMFAMEIRIEDIRQRREHKEDLRKSRTEAQEKEKERSDKRDAGHHEAKLNFDDKVAAELEAKKQEAIDNPPEVAEGEEPPAEEEPFVPEFDSE